MENEKIKWTTKRNMQGYKFYFKNTHNVNAKWLYFKLSVPLGHPKICFLCWLFFLKGDFLYNIVPYFGTQLFMCVRHVVCLGLLPCISRSSPKCLLSVWLTDFHCLKAVLLSLPAEAGCVMNPIVHLFHGCHASAKAGGTTHKYT